MESITVGINKSVSQENQCVKMGEREKKEKKTSKSKDKEKEKKNKNEKKKVNKEEDKKVETVIPIEDPKDEEKRKEDSQKAYEENYEAEEKDWNRAWKILKNTITITMPCIFGEEGTFHYKTLIAYTIAVLTVIVIWANITRLQEELYCCYYLKILQIFIPLDNPGCHNPDPECKSN